MIYFQKLISIHFYHPFQAVAADSKDQDIASVIKNMTKTKPDLYKEFDNMTLNDKEVCDQVEQDWVLYYHTRKYFNESDLKWVNSREVAIHK